MAKYVRKGARRVRKNNKKRVVSKAVAAANDKIFAKRVQKVISKNVETKRVIYTSSVTAFNQPINAAGDGLRIIPQVSNGTLNNQRIGNSIRSQGIKLRGVLTFTLGQTASANCRIGVRMFILRAKRFMNWADTQADLDTNSNKLLEGTLTGSNGSLAAFNTPYNPDYYSVVLDKKFYMSQSVQQSGVATPGQAQISETTKFVNMTIPYSRRLINFDDQYSLNEAVNYPYIICLSYTKLAGDAPDGVGTSYLTFQYTTTMEYEDA